MSKQTNNRQLNCAIYTRKSTDEGLDKEFNSLDAQRECAEAYIKSQTQEGWYCVPDRYDDGGFTGGNMERPALRQLLADIEAGKVNCVVVYKVDRLSRSLMDFARMLEVFERNQVAFVSVTQQFNTTNSMGRLMLNVLLSFAQFERELISERTRDKIAAARRKGKWSGGMPLLGYDIDGQGGKLRINEVEANKVRAIYDLYLERESIMATIAELDQRGWTNKIWQTRKGTQRGGSPFTKATLFRLLTNVTYIGKLGYKNEVNEGEQEAIISAEVWQKVQSLLRRNGRTGGVEARNKFGALLRGILRCACCDCSMTPTHTTKNGVKRYRYYVCIKAQKRGWINCKSKSVPAAEIEKFVVDKIRHVGHDSGLVDEVVEQAKIQLERELWALVTERDGLVKELEYWNEAIRIAAPTIKPGDPKSTSLEQLADWHESLHRAEHRHMIVAAKLQAPTLSERQLYRHRQRAGARIGDNKTVDLLRYCAWMHVVRHTPRPSSGVDPYDAMKERARARNAALALAGRDIGELPEVDNPDRKDRASRDFRYFCETYFPLTFHLAWSPDHIKVINKIEQAVVHGGLFALAMARGSGKSSIAEVACIWAVLYGHRNFVCLIGSDEGHACDMLDSIKTELDSNDLLLADFPEACFPIQALDGISNRANGQLYKGKRTQIGWTAKEIVLPTIADSPASGAIIKVAGLTGRIRGMKFKRPDGHTVRPSLVVLDDPQTDESARSLSQCANRESILAGAVLGLAGPGKKISGIMPCTVIRPSDMADSILDRNRHPEWNGERTKMVYAFPANELLWQRYAEIRAEGMRNGDGGESATEFYRENRTLMDAGSIVAWPERFNYDELSAIQHAMNLKMQDEAAFFAEYQNQPLPEETVADGMLKADEVMTKFNRMDRGSVSIGANHLTAFIDVQQKLLFYVVAAWEDDFTGYVVDYGCYPDQQRPYFTLRDARQTLALEAAGTGLEGSIYSGLETLTSRLLDREWKRDDGAVMKIGRCLVDANWGHSTDVVYQFCRQSKHAAVIMPSHGRFVGASSLPFSEYRRRPGDRVGLNWRIPNVHGKRAIRHVVYDTNWWKSFVNARFRVAMGDRGCLSIFGNNPETHRMFAEQITAEYFIRTEGRGRTVDEWKQRPEQPDNHWFDCLVGSSVAASMQGALLFGTDAAPKTKKDRTSFKEMQSRRKPK